jgi:23S rRNA (uracil1939-C5)-methyltransferase
VPDSVLVNALATGKLIGVSTRGPAGQFATAGRPFVSDELSSIAPGGAAHARVRRHAESFFQGNRFLLPALVSAVLDAVPADGEVLDLYAGVGLFSIALAATRQVKVTAVEGDRTSGADLQDNARPLPCLQAIIANVEDYLARVPASDAATTLVDPPRRGLSKAAIAALIQHRSPRIVYVSCDPPTLARDARKLLDAGYRLESIRGFDLFPNTPHVETVSVFLG